MALGHLYVIPIDCHVIGTRKGRNRKKNRRAYQDKGI